MYQCFQYLKTNLKQLYQIVTKMSSKDYQLLNKLGTGAFGVVFKARNKKDNSICVIKQINLSKLANNIRKIALNQAKIMKQINSNYIVKFFAEFIQKSTINIVMEYCSGGDLATFIKSQMGKPIKQETIWKFTIQMLVGLRDLHAKKILHRDIKSLNVFLDSQKNVKIGDLGVAKEMKTDFTHTIVGTPYYLSPQMCQEKPYNEKTDIWAFGCLLYQLCTGNHPFQAQNQAALALKIVIGKYKDIPNHYSKDLQWVIKSCLSVDHKRRPTATFLLSKQQIIEWANKTNVKLEQRNKQVNIQPKQAKIQVSKKIQSPNKQKVKVVTQDAFYKKSQQNNAVKNLNHTNQAVKRVQRQKSKQKKPNANNPQINVNKPVSKQKKTPYVPLPVKKQVERINLQQPQSHKAKKVDPAILQKPANRSLQKKQKVKVNQSQPAKKVDTPKIQTIKTNTQINKPTNKPYQSPRKRGSIGNIGNIIPNQVSRYESEDIKDRAQFNRQDLQNMKNFDQIPNDSSSESQDEKPVLLSQSQKANAKRQQKKSLFIGMAQQQVNQDDLMADFGISNQKQKSLNTKNFELKNTKTINWEVQQQKADKMHEKQTEQKPSRKKSNSPKSLSDIKQLPTVKTPSNTQQVDQVYVKQGDEDQIMQQLDDNRPYHSDQESIQNGEDKVQQELLIESNGQEQLFLLEKKVLENQKRKKQLQQLKKLHESELTSKIKRETYEKLKQRVINGTDEEVQKLLKTAIKDSSAIIKFYKIFQWDLQIERCNSNIKGFQQKIDTISKEK